MSALIEIVREPSFRLEERTIRVGGTERSLRLARFDRGWLASVDTESGPTLGADRSPYLAAWRALEPLGVDLSQAMALVSSARLAAR